MAVRIERTPQAAIDIDEIWLSIASDNVRAADRVVTLIDDAENRLAEFPQIGRTRDELGLGVRSWAVGEYLIFYTLRPGAVTNLRVIHGARDIAQALSEP